MKRVVHCCWHLTLVVTDFLGLYRNRPEICGSLPESSDLRRASMDTGFSTNALDGGSLYKVIKRSTSILHNHVLREVDTDDWPSGPVVDHTRVSSPFRSSQSSTGRLVHVVLVIVAEYPMKQLQRG
jgi:hypothetical protein